jgi:manganese oxidase
MVPRSFTNWYRIFVTFLVMAFAPLLLSENATAQTTCVRTIRANVVALDQVFFYNRLGAVNPAGMIYALRRDVAPINSALGLVPGNVQLRLDKRARPIVLRMNVGDCLQISFQNLLDPVRADEDQPATRTASVHVQGLSLVGSIASDGSNVGVNSNSLVAPGGSRTYTYYAGREGNHLLYSTAATTGGEGNGGTLSMGLFGSVNVQASGAEWYRSQLTAKDLQLATTGQTAGGQPIINYDAVYPAGHPRAGTPILKILHSGEIVHSDLNAVITGPNKGRFPAGTYRPNATSPDRDQPFREFTVVYHDEIKAVQAFPQFEDPVLQHTLHGVRDGFAINYGTGGVGAEILANRFKVGPMRNCVECKYEEFFLSSWTVSDPAQIVDVPANTTDAGGKLITGAKATKVLFPDDPSNVHHSYLNDHVKFRIVHAGPKEHHIHHLHAHQWLHTPDSDNSTYLDSQAIGPGSAFTTEIAYNGGGNRNKTAGDSIFHCHFYPHFAQGMWELWRVHDVLETGTMLDAAGRPAPGSRALPDGEIAAGTPIPAVVPLPTIAMATMPTANFPGYPFFIPGVAGHRPPHPPLDTIDDGGLPRHVILDGTAHSVETRLDFSKELLTANAMALPENGTPAEVAAMNFHALRQHASFKPDGAAANFITNGLPPKPGAPYADPCVDDLGRAVGAQRLYKAAAFQFDIKLNKAGWHFPQQRILSLWDDVNETISGTRAPEPFFFRANTNDCITFHHTNLVPGNYEQDDFQIRTPTDIIGQHIHLVKFDVTSSDGSGNGFNYEDGTFSPDDVIERINAINTLGGLRAFNGTARTRLTPKAHPYFGTLGAQTTVQRWFADNVLNNGGQDRTLRTVFTHDHFGPSTHQQVGLYAGLVVEPIGSQWRDSETGVIFGSRFDGGPTSWRADILTSNQATSYREFLLEFSDFQLAYTANDRPINPPAKKEVGLPFLLEPAPQCPGGVPRPCPEAISADEPGTMVVNYRNEPLALRVRNPFTNTQAAGDKGDLSMAFRSMTREDPLLNVQPSFYPRLTKGVKPTDPFTPLMRFYENDKVQIRILVGGQEEGHNFSVHGTRWLFEPSDPNSGWRNSQMMGISEHYEFVVPPISVTDPTRPFADHLYMAGAATDDLWNGIWGIARVYNKPNLDRILVQSATASAIQLPADTPSVDLEDATLMTLPNNPAGQTPADPALTEPAEDLTGTSTESSSASVGSQAILPGPVISPTGFCPSTAPARTFNVTAVTAQQALPGGTLVYNPRPNNGGPLNDPTAIVYVRTSDLDLQGTLKLGVPIEPLILRANAGDCITLTLNNRLPATAPDLPGFNTLPMIVERFNANQVRPSSHVGLHPQLLTMDVIGNDGANVGFNKVQTAPPGGSKTYRWYAGDFRTTIFGARFGVPVEFGVTNLISSDRIKHGNKGAIGSLIIEPRGSTWTEDVQSRASATVTPPSGVAFREFVLLFQNDVNFRFGDGSAVPNTAEAEDPEDTGQKALNYRSEPLWKRLGFAPDLPLEQTRDFIFTNALTNGLAGGDPVTPVFTATAGTPVRFRILQPAGHARNGVFQVHGHIWEEEPYASKSMIIGPNPLSEWKGSQAGHGPTNHFEAVLKYGAGGAFRIVGDYLYRDQASFAFDGGMWGIFRVKP